MAATPLPQIIAMGDHRFERPEGRLLSGYVLAQARTQERPRVCYLPQAGGEDHYFITAFYRHFLELGATPSHLSLFSPHTADLAGFLLEQDVIFVGGGNTKSMLALWREWGLDAVLRRAWEAGIVLAGPSAGANCWFVEGLTDSVPGDLTSLPGLGFLPMSCCPHFDGEEKRRPTYHRMVGSGQMRPGYGVDDFAGLHFIGAELSQVAAGRPTAAAYRIEPDGRGGVTETRLDAVFLG